MDEDIKLKIVADENIPFVEDAFCEFGDVVTFQGRSIDREKLLEADMLFVRSVTKVNRELLNGTKVKFVGTATIGVDHIDRSYLKEAGIGFASAVGCNASSVAEYVISAILTLKNDGKIEDNPVLGIIGAGNVGSELFKKAEGMGIKTILNDPPKKRLTGCEIYRPLDELLQNADIISIHVPLNLSGEDSTYHLVNQDFLQMMRPGATLINSSRGDVVDETALLQSRKNKKIPANLILDVWHNEPQINYSLVEVCDIATPHIAGYSWDGKVRGTELIHDAAAAFFFRESKWHGRDLISNEVMQPLKITKGNALYEAITSVYNIMEDDINLRKNKDLKKEKQAEAFDSLRKNYRRRLEFPHFSVEADSAEMSERDSLSALGFSVNYLN